MGRTLESIREHGVIAVVDVAASYQLLDWAKAVAEAGVRMLGVPVTLPNVTEVVDDLADQADLIVGVTGVMSADQLSIAFAAGASYVLSPIAEPEIVRAGRERGIDVIAGAATTTEVARARAAGAEMISIHPAGAMGGVEYFSVLARHFRGLPLLVSGAVNVENAPGFLEAGALGAIVDGGVFPDAEEPSALEVITARAGALMEVCAHAMGTPVRVSMAQLLAPGSAEPAPEAGAEPPGPGSGQGLGELFEKDTTTELLLDGATPLQEVEVGDDAAGEPSSPALDEMYEAFDE